MSNTVFQSENVANVISVSGGKDSTALALLAIESEAANLSFVFADTGNEHSQTYEYVEYLSRELKSRSGVGITTVSADFSSRVRERKASLESHRDAVVSGSTDGLNGRLKGYSIEILNRVISALNPTGNPFLDLCLWKGRFPGTKTRFCSQELKHNPLNNFHNSLEGYGAVISWQGVRADESAARKNLGMLDVEFGGWHPAPYGQLIYRPLIDWSAQDCFDMHKKHGVDHNPLYSQGMGRVGCMPCIHSTKLEVREISSRFPEVLSALKEWENVVSACSKLGSSTFFDGRVTSRFLGTSISKINHKTHGVDAYVGWARAGKGKRDQPDMLDVLDITDEVPVCSSIYGLCE